MSVFHRKRKNKNGRITLDKKWSVDFADHTGIIRRVVGFTDKAASVELERQLLRLVSLRLSGLGIDVDAAKFLESCPESIKAKLATWNVIPGQPSPFGPRMPRMGKRQRNLFVPSWLLT